MTDARRGNSGNFMDHARGVVSGFMKGRRAARLDRARRPNWESGKNLFRLFTYPHVVTKWDVIRGDMGYTDADVGTTREELMVPVMRYFIDGMAMNGLGRTYDCPLFKRWCEFTPAQRKAKYRERPQEMFLVNVLDLNRVGDGIQPRFFSRSEWLGAMGPNRVQLTYGIFNLIAGYPLDQSGEGEEEELVGPSAGLPSFDGYGDVILGPQGQDIAIFKKRKKIGTGEFLVLDDTYKGGPIRLTPKEDKNTGQRLCVEIPDEVLKGIQDLCWIPAAYPGWHGRGMHLPVGGAPDMVERFTKAADLFKEGKKPLDPSDPLPPEPEADKSESPVEVALEVEPEGMEPTGFKKGDDVVVTDKDVEDGVEIVTQYVGTFLKESTPRGHAEVKITEEAQTDDRSKAMVKAAIEKQGTDVFKVEIGQVTPAG